MKTPFRIALTAALVAGASGAIAQGVVNSPRLSAALANELVGETVAICTSRGYKVWAVVVNLDGVRQALLRGDGAPIHSQDNAYYKAYSAASLTLGRNEGSTGEVVQGSQLADQAGQALGEIESVSARLAELIQSISLASKQQARSSESLSKAMSEIAGVTQQTAAGTTEATVSISHLAMLADELRSSVSTFKLPVTANGQSHTM